MEKRKKVFITVGTTKFEALIRAVDDEIFLRALYERGYKEVRIQIGAGEYRPRENLADLTDLKISYYRYDAHYKRDVNDADLIISHAGAGSCMDALSARKKLIVVINTKLMNNHQMELAEALAEKKYCISTDCQKLHRVITSGEWEHSLTYYPDPDGGAFPNMIDSLMGIANKSK